VNCLSDAPAAAGRRSDMLYAQIAKGQKLHIVREAGERIDGEIVRYGNLSRPLCNAPHFKGRYRMTCNLPLANACRNCLRIISPRKEAPYDTS
jgi:hypothetical protein